MWADATLLGWSWTQLSDISNTQAGGTPTRADGANFGGGIPWVKSGEVEDRITSTEESISMAGLCASSAKWVERNTPLVAMYGATAGQIGWLQVRATTNQAVLAVPTNASAIQPRWLFWALRHSAPRLLSGLQGSGQGNLSKGLIDRLDLQVPPLPEQRRIAEILDTLDEAIRKTEQVIHKLQQMKQGLLHDLLTRGIDDNGELRDPERHPEQFKDSPLGRIPRGWEVKALGDLGSFMNGVNKPKHAFGHGTKFVNISDVYPDTLNTDILGRVAVSITEIPRYRLMGGDVLIDRSSVKLDGVGYPTLFTQASETVVFCGFIIRLRPTHPEMGEFICRQMRSSLFRLRLFKVATVSANVNVNQVALGRLLVVLPTPAERQHILESQQALEVRVVDEERQCQKLRTLKKGLMDDLLTGRVRVATEVQGDSV